MDVREKLVELLAGCPCESDCDGMVGSCPHRKNGNCNEIFKLSYCAVSKLAQHLIANGVTVQEWISVKDERKPNHGDIALCYMTFGEYRLLQWDDRSKLWVGDYIDFGFEDAAYWQMPKPPKGE